MAENIRWSSFRISIGSIQTDLDSDVEVHTFALHRDADFFLQGVEATGQLDLDMTATRPVPIEDGRFGIVLSWRQGEPGLSQFNH